ncbi:MAG: hypothetical protein ACPLVG_10400 [Pseudothermotoga sp.]
MKQTTSGYEFDNDKFKEIGKEDKIKPSFGYECVKARILSNLLKDWYSENTKLHGEL